MLSLSNVGRLANPRIEERIDHPPCVHLLCYASRPRPVRASPRVPRRSREGKFLKKRIPFQPLAVQFLEHALVTSRPPGKKCDPSDEDHPFFQGLAKERVRHAARRGIVRDGHSFRRSSLPHVGKNRQDGSSLAAYDADPAFPSPPTMGQIPRSRARKSHRRSPGIGDDERQIPNGSDGLHANLRHETIGLREYAKRPRQANLRIKRQGNDAGISLNIGAVGDRDGFPANPLVVAIAQSIQFQKPARNGTGLAGKMQVDIPFRVQTAGKCAGFKLEPILFPPSHHELPPFVADPRGNIAAHSWNAGGKTLAPPKILDWSGPWE